MTETYRGNKKSFDFRVS